MKKININRLIVLVMVLAIIFSSFCGMSSFLSVMANGDVPIYDEQKHTDISVNEALNGGKNDDGSILYDIADINYADISNILNIGFTENATIFGSATLAAGSFATNAVWDGQYIALATAIDWSGNYGYLMIKFTQGDNIDLQLVDGSLVNITYVGGHISTLKPAYPNTGASFGSESRKIVYALSRTNFTLWVDGVKVIDNYEWAKEPDILSSKPIFIEDFIVGVGAVNSKTIISNYRVWTDKESAKEPIPTYVSGSNLDVTATEEIELAKAKDGSYSIVDNNTNYIFLRNHEKTRLVSGAIINGSAKIAPDNFADIDNTLSLIIAKTEQGNVAITLTAENGVELWIIDENGNKLSVIYNTSYNDATYSFGSDTRKMTYSVSENTLSVWSGVDKIIDNLEWKDISVATTITDFVFGVAAKGDRVNITGYRVWGSKQYIKVIVPTYDSKLHIDISSRSDIDGSISTDGSYSFTTTNNLYSQVKEFGGVIIDDNATIYGSVTLSPSTIYMNQWGGVILPIAKAKLGGNEGKLFVKFTHGDRIDVQLSVSGTEEPIYIGALLSALKPAYPDGTSNFGDKPHDVVYMINKTAFTLWVDGVKVIDNFVWADHAIASYSEITIESFILGIEAVNSTVNAQGYRVWVDKSEGTVTAPVYDKDKHYDITSGIELNGKREENGSFSFESGTNSFESTVKITSDNVSSVATLLGAVKYSQLNWKTDGLLYLNLGKAACGDISGDFQLALTQNRGAYLRIKNGDKEYNLGDTIPLANISYPNGDSFPTEDTVISYEINDEWISIWLADVQIIGDFKLKEALDFQGNAKGIYLSAFAAGLGSENVKFTASNYRVWSDLMFTPTPVFNSETDVNILSEMEAITIGGGAIYKTEKGNVTIGSSEFGDGDGTNSGVMFAGSVLREGGTMYYHTVIHADTELDPTLVNAQTYGGPVIRLANAKFYMQQRTGGYDSGVGYFDILFTNGDSIDFRIRDLTGYDEYYVGASIPDFKIIYPDTYNASIGSGEYEVTIALNNRYISMWINGKALLLNHSLFDLKGTSTDNEYVMEMWDFAPGILYNLSKGTAGEFKVWCSKEDYEPYEIGEVSYPDEELNEAFAAATELAKEKDSVKSDSSKE